MKSNIRAIGAAVGLAMAAVIGVASFAWACTVQAHVSGLSPEEGPAGTKVTVTAENFEPGDVQIRWNGTTGPLLGTATGPAFSVTVTIPDVVPDTYSIVAVKRTGDSIVGKASAAFEVLPGRIVESGGYSSTSNSTSTDPGGTEAGQTSSARTSRSGQTATQAPANEPATSGSTTRSGQSQLSTGPAPSSAEATTDVAGTQPATNAASATAAQPTTRSGGRAATSASPSAGSTEPGSAPAAATSPVLGSDDEQVAPSPRTAWGDLGSGFASGEPARGPSLTDATPASGSSPATVGMLGLGVGMVALVAGFGVAEARRLRALATRSAGK